MSKTPLLLCLSGEADGDKGYKPNLGRFTIRVDSYCSQYLIVICVLKIVIIFCPNYLVGNNVITYQYYFRKLLCVIINKAKIFGDK